jgi:RNA polymerase sigma-54 factor
VASQTAIKQRIAELVSQEDGRNPLSDDQLADMLEQRDKVRIARRTVTKYRKALSIPSSSQRRVF